MSRTPEYRAWGAIKARCLNPNVADYRNYGGRGIRVCDEWLHDFMAFYRHVGARPSPKYSVDRYPDLNGDYKPGNVRWATRKEQQNNRRDNHPLTYNGRTENLQRWAEITGIGATVLLRRIQRGWTAEDVITKPAMTRNLTHEGITQSAAAWARSTGIPVTAIYARLKQRWPIADVVTKPANPGVKRATK
jgi:hypothetical protein